MKNIIKIAAIPALAVMVASGCKKSFDSLNTISTKPTSVPSSLLFNGILNDMYENPAAYDRPNQYFLCNYDYYGNNRYDFGSGSTYYGTLTNVIKMEDNATAVGLPAGNVYEAMGKFFRAYLFSKMTMQMGDVPMSQALLGAANLKPAYDAQKDVFKKCFQWLDSANTMLGVLVAAGDQSMSGDIYYGNNIAKWQKAVNTYRLRLLIELSKKADDGNLNVKGQFKDIISTPSKYPLMAGMDDNLQYTYVHPTNDYPNSPDNYGFDAQRYNTSATYVGLATKLKDPRVFLTAEPAASRLGDGVGVTDFAAYLGADPGEDIGKMYVEANNGDYSFLNRWHYYQTYTAEPAIQVGYPEMCLNIAEGINRGWATGDAEAWYKKAIIASWSFYGIPQAGDLALHIYKSGGPGKSDVVYTNATAKVNFEDYYSQTVVKYAGNTVTGLTQILQQKYLAFFRSSGLEPYYQFRRTGIPTFTTGPGTGNSGRVALRFQYPGSERTVNTDNYEAALSSQYGGNDDINGVMWLLK